MRKNLTEMVFILDKSGSMAGLEDDTIGGYNSMIAKQRKEEGNAIVSTVLFSDNSCVIHDRVDIREITPLTGKQYYVGGCTALIDAIGGAINHIGNVHKYAREEDIPEHTVFVITTDGMENASHMYTLSRVKTMVKHQQKKYGWEFIFLGANMDAIDAAGRIGIRADRAATFTNDSEGQALNYECVGEALHQIRGNMPLEEGWKSKIEENSKKHDCPHKSKRKI